MKIILSRKGFDSSYGGVPSPILPDGSLVSLPIPSISKGAIPYDCQYAADITVGKLVSDLTRLKYTAEHTAHVDPDLRANALNGRLDGWRPIFGQAAAAQTHLARAGIGPDDLFLFFGWFRQVELHQGCFRFVRNAPDLHVIFGWLQVADVMVAGPLTRTRAPKWARYHTHFYNSWRGNTIYLARSRLNLASVGDAIPGGGVFTHFRQELCLTAAGQTRSVWRLPVCFAPASAKSIMSYHHNFERWKIDGKHCEVRTVGKGQEFVIDPRGRPGVMAWVRKLFRTCVRKIPAARKNWRVVEERCYEYSDI